MKTIKLNEKEYPFLINNNVYEAIVDEMGVNPFGEGFEASNPKAIKIIVYNAIREGIIVEGKEMKLSYEDVGRMLKTEDMLFAANLFMEDLLDSLDYAKQKLGGKEGKK